MKNRKLLWLILALVLVAVIVVLAVVLPKSDAKQQPDEPVASAEPAESSPAPAETATEATSPDAQAEETEILPITSVDEFTSRPEEIGDGTAEPVPSAEPTPNVDPSTGIELGENELPIMP